MTSFEFSGAGEEVGSIVPLPAVPTKVERGGDWTLQRLQREIAPPVFEAASLRDLRTSCTTRPRCCNRRTVDALDITILRGGGDAVGKWAIDHGFLLTPDAPEVLDFYSAAQQIFMAARFDAARGRTARAAVGRRYADHADHPDRRTVGAAANPRARSRPDHRRSTPTCSCSPTSGPPCSPPTAGCRSPRATRRRP